VSDQAGTREGGGWADGRWVGRWRVGRWRTASLASSGLYHDHWYEVGHRPCGGPGLRPRAGPTASARPAIGPLDAATHRLHTTDCDERQVDDPSEPNGPPEASTTALTTGLFACAATPAVRACATGSAGLRSLRELKKRLRWSVRLSRFGRLGGNVREDEPRGFLSSSAEAGRPRGLIGFSRRSVVTNTAAPSIVPSTSVVQKQRQQRPGLVPSSTMAWHHRALTVSCKTRRRGANEAPISIRDKR
jgi:hypothetical protein